MTELCRVVPVYLLGLFHIYGLRNWMYETAERRYHSQINFIIIIIIYNTYIELYNKL